MPEIVIGLIAGIAVLGGVLALGRLLAASPRATLATVVGVTVGLIAIIAQWPGLLLADAAIMLVLGVLADALLRHTLFLARDKPGRLTRAHMSLINWLRKAFDQPDIWLIPEHHLEPDERAMQTHAARLVAEISDALKCSP